MHKESQINNLKLTIKVDKISPNRKMCNKKAQCHDCLPKHCIFGDSGAKFQSTSDYFQNPNADYPINVNDSTGSLRTSTVIHNFSFNLLHTKRSYILPPMYDYCCLQYRSLLYINKNGLNFYRKIWCIFLY